MSQVSYIPEKNALAYFKEAATADFWDRHWDTKLLADQIRSCKSDVFFTPYVKKYLPDGGRVLEGGCGPSYLVHALYNMGYETVGVDFAEKTVKAVNEAVPELDVRLGNVFKLDLEDHSFDGYISGGVIEHFWEGYEGILSEMSRVIKKGGYLFITFPYMSILRQLKVTCGQYEILPIEEISKEQIEKFYQFALDFNKTKADLEKYHFELVEYQPQDGVKGFKDELKWSKEVLQPIYDKKKNVPFDRNTLNSILKPFAGHIMLAVFRKS